MRLMQHKKEAFWFYRFLSVFYDKFVNPLFWTKKMRDESLTISQLEKPGLTVIDVGSGTGFTTEGIVKLVPPARVTCIDQSPHQMAKAKQKTSLQGCHFKIGDAENIPFETDSFDRYVSAGSIEYWPNPQKGITEAYRVIKPNGVATLIGPLDPPNGFVSYIANTWMLFPKDKEYRDWFKNAGFEKIEVKYVYPHWIKQKDKYCIAISGTKPKAGVSPIEHTQIINEPLAKEDNIGLGRVLMMIGRMLLGSLAGFIFIPIALLGYLRNSFRAKEKLPEEYRERLNGYQIMALLVIGVIVVSLMAYVF
ncbi:MAG: MPBQ/MSBQ methyltransferase [Saprospiraceae bacterium]|jgi:MPBQ/MSBQ methyltransferase